MKGAFYKLDKAFESKVRLGIMSSLMVNEWMDFNDLKTVLNLTDGNLATHLKNLENKEYIMVEKSFVNRKPKSQYKITNKGNTAFKTHLEALEEILKNSK